MNPNTKNNNNNKKKKNALPQRTIICTFEKSSFPVEKTFTILFTVIVVCCISTLKKNKNLFVVFNSSLRMFLKMF